MKAKLYTGTVSRDECTILPSCVMYTHLSFHTYTLSQCLQVQIGRLARVCDLNTKTCVFLCINLSKNFYCHFASTWHNSTWQPSPPQEHYRRSSSKKTHTKRCFPKWLHNDLQDAKIQKFSNQFRYTGLPYNCIKYDYWRDCNLQKAHELY